MVDFLGRNCWFKEKVDKALHLDTKKQGWQEQLGQAMFDLNIAGVNDRYGEGHASKFRKLNYRYTPVIATMIQVLKSLHCWLYQCTEGEVVKKPLFQFFDTIIERRLTDNIIYDLPEYKHADWG